MAKVLIVEDDPADIRTARLALESFEVKEIDMMNSVGAAVEYLHDVAERKREQPALIILDLEFVQESGFEILRLWKGEPRLRGIDIVVWTKMGELQQQMCRLFGLKYVVPKWKGNKEFQEKLHLALTEHAGRSNKKSAS